MDVSKEHKQEAESILRDIGSRYHPNVLKELARMINDEDHKE